MLESRARTRSGSVAEAMRSKIVLSLAAGNSQAQTSRAMGCSVNTVRLWKERFVGERLGGLYGSIVDGVAAKKAFDSRPECCDWPNANRRMARRIGRLARLPPKWAPTTSG